MMSALSGSVSGSVSVRLRRRLSPFLKRTVRYGSYNVIKEDDPSSIAIWKAAKPFKSIPGPGSYPLVGVLPHLIRDMRGGLVDHMLIWHKKYGPIVRSSNPSYLGGNSISCYDPELLKIVLQNGKNNSRNIFLEQKMLSIHRKMKSSTFMFFASGDEWKTLRSAMNKPSTPRRVAMFSSQLYDAANELGTYWLEKRGENGVIDDIRDDLQKWALKGVTWFAFNKDLSVFRGSDEMSKEFNRSAVAFVQNLPLILRALPLYEIYPTRPYKNYVSAVTNLHAIGEKMMESRFKQIQQLIEDGQDIDSSERISLMEHLLIEGKVTKETALSQVCDLLAAGVDTTSSTASFLLHHIANDPQLQQALFDEISSVCGLQRMPNFNELQKLSLVRNCVKETLRLYPIARVIFRTAECNLVVNGYQIPKNTSIIFNLSIMGKDPKLYSNPSVFDPYRWSSKELDDTLVSFANLPFGAGVRMCYGRRLAELELHLLLVTMIQRFVLSTDQSSLATSLMPLLKPAESVRLKMQER